MTERGRENEREAAGTSDRDSARPPTRRWRAEFPYRWDADELVSRRWLLQFVVYTSGTLFAGTAILAALGLVRRPEEVAVIPVARASEIPEGGARYFRYPGPEDEAMLLHLPGGRFVAYSQKCTHLSCSVLFQAERGRLFCPCHEGVFDPLTGEPTAGPPPRRLPRIELRQEGDTLYAVGRTL